MENNLRIVHVVESFTGGLFTFLRSLTTELRDCTHVILHGYRQETPANLAGYFPQNTRLYEWKSAHRAIGPSDVFAFKELYAFLKKSLAWSDRPVIHLHSSKAGFLGRIACRVLGIHSRVVYTSHGAAFLRKDVSSGTRSFFMALEKAAFLAGGQVIACSESEADVFRKNKIPADAIANGTLAPPRIKPPAARSEDFTVCGAGRITAQKGPRTFNCIAHLLSDSPGIRFVWIGDGELRHMLKSPNIEITGRISHTKTIQHMASADIFLSTSLWEGMSLSVLEAMSLSKPLMLSKCVGNTDLVQKATNGYMFSTCEEAADRLKHLAADKVFCRRMGSVSRERWLRYHTAARMAQKYQDLYRRISGSNLYQSNEPSHSHT